MHLKCVAPNWLGVDAESFKVTYVFTPMCLPCNKHHLQWWPNVCGKALRECCKNKDTISFPQIAHGSSKMLSSR